MQCEPLHMSCGVSDSGFAAHFFREMPSFPTRAILFEPSRVHGPALRVWLEMNRYFSMRHLFLGESFLVVLPAKTQGRPRKNRNPTLAAKFTPMTRSFTLSPAGRGERAAPGNGPQCRPSGGGGPIARIVAEARLRQQEIDEAIADIKDLGKQTGKATVEEILSLIREGRKY